MRKKRILFHSDFALAKTGFGRVMRALLSYLYKTGKYELHEYCCGSKEGSLELSLTPWTSHGCVPNDDRANPKNENEHRSIAYGSALIDETVSKVKPDIYIGAQDIWGIDYSIDKPWFNKITSCIWTTLDSLPILPAAVKRAPDIKNYWVWSSFAEKALHELGFNHVKTVHGAIDASPFYKLSEEEKKNIRIKNNLPEDAFIIGFVFRNQLRKSVPNLIEGYKTWKKRNPGIKNTYLLLHTSFSEGWNIKAQADQHGIDTKEILTTYICHSCNEYEVKCFDDRVEKFQKAQDGSYVLNNGEKVEQVFSAEQKDCRFCGAKKSQHTTNVGKGVSEYQLNHVYNLMDVYVHPFTSGGQEIPIQEAKLTELITLVTNYSCGEECCKKEAHSLPLEWSKYIEHGTEFIKASTLPSSIADQLDYFISLSKEEKKRIGNLARSWAIDNFSVEVVGRIFEDFIENSPLVEDRVFEDLHGAKDKKNHNPDAVTDISLPDEEWIKSLYEKILDSHNVSNSDDGFLYWMKQISNGTQRQQIEEYFRQVARKESRESSEKKVSIDSLIEKNNKKKLLYVMPESLGDCFLSTSIFPSLRRMYNQEDWDIYVSSKPQFKDVFAGNKNITKWIPYSIQMDNQLLMEGTGKHKGWFDICFTPYVSTQRIIDYVHNGINKLLM